MIFCSLSFRSTLKTQNLIENSSEMSFEFDRNTNEIFRMKATVDSWKCWCNSDIIHKFRGACLSVWENLWEISHTSNGCEKHTIDGVAWFIHWKGSINCQTIAVYTDLIFEWETLSVQQSYRAKFNADGKDNEEIINLSIFGINVLYLFTMVWICSKLFQRKFGPCWNHTLS